MGSCSTELVRLANLENIQRKSFSTPVWSQSYADFTFLINVTLQRRDCRSRRRLSTPAALVSPQRDLSSPARAAKHSDTPQTHPSAAARPPPRASHCRCSARLRRRCIHRPRSRRPPTPASATPPSSLRGPPPDLHPPTTSRALELQLPPQHLPPTPWPK